MCVLVTAAVYRSVAAAKARSSVATASAVGRPSGSVTQQRSASLSTSGGTVASGGLGQGGLRPSISWHASPDRPHSGLSSAPHTKVSQITTPRLKMSAGFPYPWPSKTLSMIYFGFRDDTRGTGLGTGLGVAVHVFPALHVTIIPFTVQYFCVFACLLCIPTHPPSRSTGAMPYFANCLRNIPPTRAYLLDRLLCPKIFHVFSPEYNTESKYRGCLSVT